MASETTVVSEHGPDYYERMSYYNGITGDDDHPNLVYRSNFLTAPFPKPDGRYAHLPVKSVRGVYDTALNGVWDTVGPQICAMLVARGINWSSIDPARFFTNPPLGEDKKGNIGPVVIWVGVSPCSTSPDVAHDVSQLILELLRKNGIEDVVVEWREAVLRRLAGPPLMRHVGSGNPTHYVRRFLTALLGVPLATEERELEDSQGTLTLWLHENIGEDGNPSDKVYGVSNRHVLCKNYREPYEHKGSAAKSHVRVCGMRRFYRALTEIMQAIADHGILADLYAREIVTLEAREVQDRETVREIERTRVKLKEEKEAIEELEEFHAEVLRDWSSISLQRNIGFVTYAPTITVDKEGGTAYTSDWAVFEAAEAKVKAGFEGNVVDLGTRLTPQELTAMFYPAPGGPTTFKYPEQRKLRIQGCATEQDLTSPAEFDSEGQRCLIVGKDGCTTELTVGRYAGLISFVRRDGIVSRELAIYNSSTCKAVEFFSDIGDSGALVWHVTRGEAHIVGHLHSGENKGGSTSNHVTYCTPGWFLLEQIKKKYKHADFYRTTWSA